MNRCNTASCHRWRFHDHSPSFVRGYEARKRQPWCQPCQENLCTCFSFIHRICTPSVTCNPRFSPALIGPSIYGFLFGSTVLHFRLLQNLLNPSSRYIHGSLHDLPIASSSVPVHGSEEQEPQGQVTPRSAIRRYVPSAAARVGIGCHEVGEQWRSDSHSSVTSWNLR